MINFFRASKRGQIAKFVFSKKALKVDTIQPSNRLRIMVLSGYWTKPFRIMFSLALVGNDSEQCTAKKSFTKTIKRTKGFNLPINQRKNGDEITVRLMSDE